MSTPDAEQRAFLENLVSAGLLIPSGVPGVHGTGAVFEDVRLAFERLVAEVAAEDQPEQLRFPPVFPRRDLESIGYLETFPHLLGSVFAFEGDERGAVEQGARAALHDDWSEFQRATDLVLLPAACYPVYPAVAARGALPPGGVMIDAGGAYVFRQEPSHDPTRLRMFHQREMVRIGEPETVASWRDLWRTRALELLRGLGLEAADDVAADPFFGRKGRILANSQREQALKLEVTVPIAGPEPTAVASFNYHQEHFAAVFGLETSEGAVAHTACLGFGEERIALALFSVHGFDPGSWPADVTARLWGKA
jgi:seryl-tRNA synthetase